MSKREIYEQKTEEILNPIMEELEFELVDVEYVKEGSMWYLRAYIDKPGGITVNDCEAVSRRLSDILDEKDVIERLSVEYMCICGCRQNCLRSICFYCHHCCIADD